MSTPYMADEENEVLDRVRRIETKLSRFLSGEQDRGSVVTHEKWVENGMVYLNFNTTAVTLHEILNQIKDEVGVVTVMDNGKARLLVQTI